jgi:acyl-CoA reductase-like NAD-dependent aldehyde dehydrogenase
MLQVQKSPSEAEISTHKMLINGAWVESSSGGVITAENPATGEEIARFQRGNAEDIDRAVRAARATFKSRVWRGMPADQRAAVLWKLSDILLQKREELMHLEVLDNGMPLSRANRLIDTAVAALRFQAGMCTKIYGRTAAVGKDLEFHAYSIAEPIGVAGLIVPWNGPIATACAKLAPALAAGCSVVLKPAEQTSLTALRLGELLPEAGFPDGVVNIVTGLGSEAGAALVEHPDVDVISFTGSTAIGKGIIAASASSMKRVVLELGGKSPVFVFDDADLDAVLPDIAMGIYANSGQVCYAGSRLYAQPKIFDRLVAGLASHARSLRIGSGLDKDTDIGPLISQKQRERVLGYVESGVKDGAELVTGGKAHGSAGYFVEPTIFAGGRHDMRIVREEIFGPVLTVMPFSQLDEVESLANDSTYGLGAGIYTRDVTNAHLVARLIQAGNVWVNCYGRLDRALPFGGFKQSGLGRENGLEGIEAFLEKKSVYVRLN